MNILELIQWLERDKFYCVIKGRFFIHITHVMAGEAVLEVYDSVTHQLGAVLPVNSTTGHSPILASREDCHNFVRLDEDTVEFRAGYSDECGIVFKRSRETTFNFDRLIALMDMGVEVKEAIRMSVEEKEI